MKLKDKNNKKITSLIVAFGLIVMGSIVYQHLSYSEPPPTGTKPKLETVIPFTNPQSAFTYEIDENEWAEEEIPKEILDSNQTPLVSNEFSTISFPEAFARARSALGAGQVFSWKGMEYTTSYAEELAVKEKPITIDDGPEETPPEDFTENAENDTSGENIQLTLEE